LAPKYIGPATIVEVNKSVAKLKTDKNKVKTLNVNKLKHFFPAEDTENYKNEETDAGTQDDNKIIKFNLSTKRPLTRAWSKLIKNTEAISTLINKSDAASSEEIWYKLNNIAFKLYHLNLDFNQLTSEELKFWKTFKQEDIFEWLSGSPIHPPDYTEYIHIRSSFNEPPPQDQPQQHPAQPQPGPTVQNQVPQPSPRKPGRPPDSKNKPKDPITRAAHYASKRFTRATVKVFSPDTVRKNANASF